VEPKKFKLAANEILQLAPKRGSCIANDRITVHGEQVGYMYPCRPDKAIGSGWNFLSGTESQAYLNDSRNLAIYEVNTIANYDPDIIPLLDAPVGSAFARDAGSGKFVPEEAPPED